ncbi:MAG: hypothetical protein VW576_04970 [Opitutae bacterium]
MKEEDIFPTPPDAPDPTIWERLSSSPYFWWFGAMLLMALVVMWLPTQCSFDALQFPQEELEDLDQEPFVDKDEELELRQDGMWYKTNGGELYTGVGITFHPNGQKKTRTKFVDGLAIGLIEEWDTNGSLLGPRFKGEFK